MTIALRKGVSSFEALEEVAERFWALLICLLLIAGDGAGLAPGKCS